MQQSTVSQYYILTVVSATVVVDIESDVLVEEVVASDVVEVCLFTYSGVTKGQISI